MSGILSSIRRGLTVGCSSGPPTCVADPHYSCGPSAGEDPHWNQTVLLLPFQGADLSTSFPDSSLAAEVITAVGGAKISTARSIIGSSSLLLNGTTDWVEADAASSNYDFGSGEWTLEFWVFPTTNGTTRTLISNLGTGTSNGFAVKLTTSNQVSFIRYISSSGASSSSTLTVLANKWSKISIARRIRGADNVINVFVDGVYALAGLNGVTGIGASSGKLSIGANLAGGGSEFFAGNIGPLRITKGVGRYWGGYNVSIDPFPTALSTSYIPADPRTVLSLHCEPVADKQIFNAPLTSNQFDTVFALNNYGYPITFDDPGRVAFTASGAQFTVAGGFNRIRYGAVKLAAANHGKIRYSATVAFAGAYAGTDSQFNPFLQVGTISTKASFYCRVDAGVLNIYRYNFSGSAILIGPAAASATYTLEWTASNVITWYIDGVAVASATENRPSAEAENMHVGSQISAASTVTSITVKDFIVEITDLEDDSCAFPKIAERFGTAALVGTQKKFGAGSMEVINTGAMNPNGTIIRQHQDFVFFQDDWTIEFWAYRNSHVRSGTLFMGPNTTSMRADVGVDGLLDVTYRSSSTVTQTNIAAIPVLQWVNYVFQRRGTAFETYVDGILVGTSAVPGGATGTMSDLSSNFFIGRIISDTATNWDGFIDEVRITKGIARYTPPPFPPVAPLPTITDPAWAETQLLVRFAGSAVDESTNGYTATLVGGSLSFVTDGTWLEGGYLQTDYAVASYYEFTNMAGFFASTTSDLCFELWMAFDTSTGTELASYSDGRRSFLRCLSGGVKQLELGIVRIGSSPPNPLMATPAAQTTSGYVFDDQPHHIALVIRRSTNQIFYYIDGVLILSASAAAAWNIDTIRIGQTANNTSITRAISTKLSAFRVTELPRYPGIVDIDNLPNCDSTVASGGYCPGDGAAGLEPKLLQLTAGTFASVLSSTDGVAALTGRRMTLTQGVLNGDNVVRLTGRSLRLQRGSVVAAPFSAPSSGSFRYFNGFGGSVTGGASQVLEMIIYPNGLITVIQPGFPLSARNTLSWALPLDAGYAGFFQVRRTPRFTFPSLLPQVMPIGPTPIPITTPIVIRTDGTLGLDGRFSWLFELEFTKAPANPLPDPFVYLLEINASFFTSDGGL